MTAIKAKKVETFYGKYCNTVIYEYRGSTYEVEYANDVSYCCTPASIQHRDAQKKIDNELDNPKEKCESRPFDLNEIWEVMEWD